MRTEVERIKLFSRRAVMVLAGKFTLFGIIVGRLYHLQILEQDKYQTLSDNNRIKLALLPPIRGEIRDRHDKKLAINNRYFRVMVDPQDVKDPKILVDKLVALLHLDQNQSNLLLEALSKASKRHPLLLYSHLTWEQVSKIEVNAPDLPGVFIDQGYVRHYPFGKVVSSIVGYIGKVSKEELRRNNPLFTHPDFVIGKTGVEKELDTKLRGKAGIKKIEVNAFGLKVREISTKNSQAGEDIALTVDVELQDFIAKTIDQRGSAAVLMDITNGDILSMVSNPTYDSNQFITGFTTSEWDKLLHHPGKPLLNKATSIAYPPGSTFKTIVALAGLEAGVIDANTHVNCEGHVTVGGRKFHCWNKKGHGSLSLLGAISQSCNVYFYRIGRKVGIEAIAEMASHFGVGELPDIPVFGTKAGVMPTPQWKARRYDRDWFVGDTLNSSIGQGYVQMTPLQLAILASRLANGKQKVTARLIKTTASPLWEPLPVAPQHMALVQRGMRAVVNNPIGTGYNSRIEERAYRMAGKTGTVQVRSQLTKDNNAVAWEERNHALFIGYAPYIHPRYALSLVVEHGGIGSKVAAPLARDILLEVQKRYAV